MYLLPLAAWHPRALASVYKYTTEASEDSLKRMLQSLLASGERVGQEKAYMVVVVVGEIARLGISVRRRFCIYS